MIEKKRRELDFIKLIEKLDISPTMFKNATEKYKNLGRYLQDQGIDSEFYPQGSFSIGTVVRPYKDASEKDYDLDFISNTNNVKTAVNPKETKKNIGVILASSELYNEKLQPEYDKCWTLKYADIGEVGFNMDIVPAALEDINTVLELQQISQNPEYLSNMIVITSRKENNYNWLTSNPKGYKEWFEKINKPFLEYNRAVKLQMMFESNRSAYKSIEEIPVDMERSSLQRVIQILKRHRDVYFSKIGKEKFKPISAILTTITAMIAENAPKNYDVFELLRYVIDEFEIYAERQTLNEVQFSDKYINKRLVNKNEDGWQIINPVNPKDNLADSWNDNAENAKYFFSWIKRVREDYIKSFDKDDELFVVALENSMGSSFVTKNFDVESYRKKHPIEISHGAKPWKN